MPAPEQCLCRRLPFALSLLLLLLFSPPLIPLVPILSASADQCRAPPLRIGVLLPDAYRRRVEPWLALAQRHIRQFSATPMPNSSAHFLRAHCLQLIPKNTDCRPSLGLKALFDLMAVSENDKAPEMPSGADQSVLALFGDICTDVNEPVAMASKNWNVVHLSFTESHAKFGTADANELYPTFFRLVPGERSLNRARCELIKAFGWRRVGSVKQSDHSSLSLSHERLTTKLEQDGVQVIYTASLSSEHDEGTIGAELEQLKKRDVHIIVADFAEQLALRVLCAAFHHGLYGADFVWILPGFQSAANGTARAQWWRAASSATASATAQSKTSAAAMVPNCTETQLQRVLEGHFALEHVRIRPYSKEARLVSGKTVRQVLREFRQFCAERDTRHQCRDELAHSTYAYDGIWTLGLALNRTLAGDERWDKQSTQRRAHRLLEAMRDTSFQGLSGRVRFDDSGERLGIVQIMQWSNGSYSALGYHDSAEEQFYLRKSVRWAPPRDATLVHRRRQHVSATLTIAMCSLALVGIFLALGFFVVNVKYRNHRFIKMSSPNMNNLIICGSLCAYLSVFLLSIDTRLVNERTFERICYAKAWILCTGFTLAFGAMFSKTWRVHSIFTNIRRDKKAIRDSKLYLIVAALLAVDGTVLLGWALVSPFRMAISEQGQFLEKNLLIVPEFERCQSDHSLPFQVVFFLFKGMLMLFGCFLAWETRAVNVPALNDSKYIGISVYIVVVLCVVGLALAFILQEHLNEAFAIVSFFVLSSTTLTLCLVFVPKVVELWQTPRGTEHHRFRKGMMKSMVGSGAGGSGRTGASGGGTFRHAQLPIGEDAKHSTSTAPAAMSAGVYTASKEALCRQLSLLSAEELGRRSAALEADNLRLHQTLVSKSTELWDLLERVRLLTVKLREMEVARRNSSKRLLLGNNQSKTPKALCVVKLDAGDDGGESLARRCSARILSTVANQLRLRRTRTSSNGL
ncbi:hypothetical protein niasHT_019170 [Heterodera trifolii]|uniref:G-protein coupled receptors family 3 profile domain-containing protein n=1 Tax=Heterodera trifolii TaxID=157864 RepID=A0ABD2LCA2_9BILA